MNENDIKILVADDTPVNVKIIHKFLTPKGFNVICAENGDEAVTKFIEEKPDIVLMDVMMPVKDGYQATKEIKEHAGDTWIPLIFLSAKSTVEDQIHGIKLGGDDYLTKPVDLNMLEVKLSALLRIVAMQRKVNELSKSLQKYVDAASEEIELAKNLINRMGERKERVSEDIVKLFTEAADNISGDLALTFQCEDPAKRYFILADATGHGLTAAISLVPLSQLFYQMAANGEAVSNIVSEINRRLHSVLPPDRFVAATVGFVNEQEKTIEVWNGANPMPRLICQKGKLLHSFDLSNFCLGIIGGDEFSSETEIVNYTENCELLFFSDGVIDAKNADEEIFGNQGIIQSLDKTLESGQRMFDVIKDDLNHFRDHDNRVDDICMLSISISH